MHSFFREIKRMIIESDLPGIVGALVVLIIGWMIAWWLAGKASGATGRCLEAQRQRQGGELAKPETVKKAAKLAGRVVFWLVMILTVLGGMSLLHLEYAAVPLREFVTVIVGYIPNIAGALLLLVLAKILSDAAAAAVRKMLEKAEDEKQLSGKLAVSAEKSIKNGSRAAYYLVWLFFLPAILKTLGIYGITAPLQAMFAAVMVFLPRVFAALVILLVGLWAARLVRRSVSSLLATARLDSLVRWCGVSEVSGESFARVIGDIAWVLVAIPVIIGALSSLGIAELSAAVSGFLNILLNAAGNIIGALLVLLAAFVIAKGAGYAAEKLCISTGIDRWWENLGGEKGVFKGIPFSSSVRKTAFAVVMVLGFIAASDVLGFAALSGVIRSFAIFGGNLLLSVIVLLIGAVLADFASGIAGDQLGKWGRTAVKAAVMIFTAALALSNLNIGSGIVEITFAMLLGTFGVAFALAFGLGGREFAAGVLKKIKENHSK